MEIKIEITDSMQILLPKNFCEGKSILVFTKDPDGFTQSEFATTSKEQMSGLARIFQNHAGQIGEPCKCKGKCKGKRG